MQEAGVDASPAAEPGQEEEELDASSDSVYTPYYPPALASEIGLEHHAISDSTTALGRHMTSKRCVHVRVCCVSVCMCVSVRVCLRV